MMNNLEPEIHPALVELDEQDEEDLFDRCLLFVTAMAARDLPKNLKTECLSLHQALTEASGYYTMH